MKKISFFVAFLIFSTSCSILLAQEQQKQQNKTEPNQKEGEKVALVEVEPLVLGKIEPIVRFSGSLFFRQNSDVASEGEGVIEAVYFEKGDFIKKGSPLAKIDADLLKASIESSKADIEQAKIELEKNLKELKRYEGLNKENAVSIQTYENHFYGVKSLEKKIESLRAILKSKEIELSKKTIYAPFDGYALTKDIDVGEWATKGKVATKMVSSAKMEAIFDLPSQFLDIAKKGNSAKIFVNGKQTEGKIVGFIQKGDQKSRTFPLVVELEGDGFFEGSEAILELYDKEQKESLLVSRNGVVKRFDQNVVFVIKDGAAKMVPVKIIGYKDSFAAIENHSLKEGDLAIYKGNERVMPNQKVKIAGKN